MIKVIIFSLLFLSNFSCGRRDKVEISLKDTPLVQNAENNFPISINGYKIVGILGKPDSDSNMKGPQGYPSGTSFSVELGEDKIDYENTNAPHMVIAYFGENKTKKAIVVYEKVDGVSPK